MLNKKSIAARVAAVIILILMFLLMATCLMPFAHGATTHPRPNSLGLSQTYRNPMSYMVGSIEHVDAFSRATNVVFKPFGASMLDTEPVLFCGDLTQNLIDGTQATLYVFAYRQQATRLYEGVACHDVYRIIQVDLR